MEKGNLLCQAALYAVLATPTHPQRWVVYGVEGGGVAVGVAVALKYLAPHSMRVTAAVNPSGIPSSM